MNIITFIDLIFLFQRGKGGGQFKRDVSIFFFNYEKNVNIITFIDLIFLFQREGGGKGGGD